VLDLLGRYRGLNLLLHARHAAPPKGSWGGPVWSGPRTELRDAGGLRERARRRRFRLRLAGLVAAREEAHRSGRDQRQRKAAEDEQRHRHRVRGARPDLLRQPVAEALGLLAAARPAVPTPNVAAAAAATQMRMRGFRTLGMRQRRCGSGGL